MKKIIFMIITAHLLTELYPWQTLLLDFFLVFAGKILCEDFVLYFNENEAHTLFMKKVKEFGCKFCESK